MQFLALFLLSWCFIASCHSEIDLSSPIDLFHDDSQLFDPEPQFEEANSLDQAFAPDSTLFPDVVQLPSLPEPEPSPFLADIDLNQIAEPDSSLLAAGENACDGSDASKPQLFGKVRRRGDSCRGPPVGKVEGVLRKPGDGDEPGDLGFTEFAAGRRLLLSVFQKDFEICPRSKFKASNIPVCKLPVPADVFPVLGVLWVSLRDVTPRTFLSYFSITDLVSNCQLIKICKVYGEGDGKECLGLASLAGTLWCCKILVSRVRDHFIKKLPPN